jgi:hypothetical protein
MEDASHIAEIHFQSWRAAYQGYMPKEVLDNLSEEKLVQQWATQLSKNDTTVLVAEIEPST